MTEQQVPSLKIATIQMITSEIFEQNLNKASDLIEKSAKQGAELVVLPEYFAIMGLKETDKFLHVEKHGDGVMQNALSQLAKRLQIWIVAGSHPIESDQANRPYARCYVYNSAGQVVTWYDKIHLFDVNVADNQKRYCESRYTKPGKQVVSFDSTWGKIGIAICYDLRFPELFRQLQQQGCQLLLVPAAFTAKTGEAHWDLLTRTRALENLCYLVSSAQGGTHSNGRQTWGRSNVISPWGEVLAQLELGEGVITMELDFASLQQIRKEFPALDHKQI
jgi:deaminated glutathione amidase